MPPSPTNHNVVFVYHMVSVPPFSDMNLYILLIFKRTLNDRQVYGGNRGILNKDQF